MRSDPDLLASIGFRPEPVAALPLPPARGRPAAVLVVPDGDRLATVPVLADPVTGWRPAEAGDGVAAAVLTALGVPPATGAERGIGAGVDQTNTSVIVDDAAVVKWIRHPGPELAAASNTLAHLRSVGYPSVPAFLGALSWDDGTPSGVVTALADRYLPAAEHGWDWAAQDAAALRPIGAELGRLAASLHVALATPSPVLPGPPGRATVADAARWHAAASATVAEAARLTPDPDGGWLRDAGLAGLLAPIARAAGTLVQTVHGDLHVGQVLRWRGGLSVTDFDGNPMLAGATAAGPAPARQPAVRDVAQLAASVDHAARIAAKTADGDRRDRLAAWSRRERAALLAGYRRELAGAGRAELFEPGLLLPFTVEQLARDLIYAARFLPRWRYAPLGSLRTIVAGGW